MSYLVLKSTGSLRAIKRGKVISWSTGSNYNPGPAAYACPTDLLEMQSSYPAPHTGYRNMEDGVQPLAVQQALQVVLRQAQILLPLSWRKQRAKQMTTENMGESQQTQALSRQREVLGSFKCELKE